jgi:chaperonin cofactor prefoldin
MAKQHHNPTTLDDLAAMINQGFIETQKHVDKRLDERRDDMATKGEVNEGKQTMNEMLEELTATHEDVRYVRNTVTILVTSDAAHEAAIESLRKRMERVENKVEIVK